MDISNSITSAFSDAGRFAAAWAVGVISAAEPFLHIPFEHANQLGYWFGELQSCGGFAGNQRTHPKAIPFLVRWAGL